MASTWKPERDERAERQRFALWLKWHERGVDLARLVFVLWLKVARKIEE